MTSARQPGASPASWPLALAVVAAAAVVGWSLPFLPAGPDVYVHVLWTQQVMRCLADGDLPLWLPDLNAGFGSPGLRLYSPLGPVLAGAIGLLLGGAGQGMRALATLAAGLPLVVLWRRGRWRGVAEWALVVASPMAVYALFWRSAWSEFYALPLVWWLIDRALDDGLSPVRDGVALALLWLLHAPTLLMTVVVLTVATAFRRRRREAVRLGLAGLAAAGLTAWHWLPLASEMRLLGNREALVGGIYEAARNVLASPAAADVGANAWLAWCGSALLAAALAGAWWRDQAARLAVVVTCVLLASPLATWLWQLPTPLGYLQFPWRFLLPASVAAAGGLAVGGRWRAGLSALALLSPLVLFHPQPLASDPGLGGRADWQGMGRAVQNSFAGNPWVVDAAQNRPAAFVFLAANLERFGHRHVLVPGGATGRVERWRALDRAVGLDLPAPARVDLRVLDYPFWLVTLDGERVEGPGRNGVLGADVPAGRHELRARWRGNPLARAGQLIALVTALGLGLAAWSARERA